MLADNPHLPEFFELLKTCPVVKLFFLLSYGLSRAGLKALHACTAITLQGLIRFKRHVGQHRDQPEPCPKFRVDKKVVPSYKAQTSQIADFLMGEMRPLPFPVYYLGGGNGKGLEAGLLYIGRKQEGCAVQEKIKLAVVVKIKRSRPVLYIFE